MKNIKPIYFLVLFMAIVNIFVLFLFYQQIKDKRSKMAILESKQSRIKDQDKIIGILKILGIYGVKAPIFNPVDQQLKSASGKTLILRFHEGDCNDCVRQSLQSLQQYKREKPEVNIRVVADYSTMEKLDHEFPFIPFSVVLIKHINLDIPTVGSPYIFLINNNRYEKVFFPNYLAMDMFNDYLKAL